MERINYIELLEQKLGDQLKSGEVNTNEFNEAEQLYESAKAQQPQHPIIETFRLIAIVYYTQKIAQAKERGENPLAYKRALVRY